ncbi:hypothetical protein [Phenylobacterium sp.]|uniref:hypothetical protein n=1 Tax=Phenylobacterium sp. TaxID=1871053 RepID=UPI0019B4A69F|nr:hypothetical protein [Phenylobacterium sp.]MBC7169236.1 hypothetical protein [Phenylobacterium sp.]
MAIDVQNVCPASDVHSMKAGAVFVDLRPNGWFSYMIVNVNGQTMAVMLDSDAHLTRGPELCSFEDLEFNHPMLVGSPQLEVKPDFFGLGAPASDLVNGAVVVSGRASVLCVGSGASKVFIDLDTGVAVQTPAHQKATYHRWILKGYVHPDQLSVVAERP